VTEPDRLSALSDRIVAVTGRTLTREQLVSLVGRAFEHDLNLDDDGQLRGLVGGMSSDGPADEQVVGPPMSYGQPTAPSYPAPQPGYPQAYPQPSWPGMNPAMAPGYPMMPPPRQPQTTRHPVGFIVGGILIALAALVWGVLTFAGDYFLEDTHLFGYLTPAMLASRVSWLIVAMGFTAIAVGARGATRVFAIIAAASAALAALTGIIFFGFLDYHSIPETSANALLLGPTVTFNIAMLITAITGLRSFGVFGLLTAIADGVLTAVIYISGFTSLYSVNLWASRVEPVVFLLFGIAVSCGKVPVSQATPLVGVEPPSGPVPGTPDGTPAADTAP